MGMLDEVVDQSTQEVDDLRCLISARGTQIDLFVVETTKRSQCIGDVGFHADPTGGSGGSHHRTDERTQLALPGVAAVMAHVGR